MIIGRIEPSGADKPGLVIVTLIERTYDTGGRLK
jgi:hypothetical protein